jgi:hypothetical protein
MTLSFIGICIGVLDLKSVHLLDIMKISKIHKREPWELSSRLIEKKYITTLQSARGYTVEKSLRCM